MPGFEETPVTFRREDPPRRRAEQMPRCIRFRASDAQLDRMAEILRLYRDWDRKGTDYRPDGIEAAWRTGPAKEGRAA